MTYEFTWYKMTKGIDDSKAPANVGDFDPIQAFLTLPEILKHFERLFDDKDGWVLLYREIE